MTHVWLLFNHRHDGGLRGVYASERAAIEARSALEMPERGCIEERQVEGSATSVFKRVDHGHDLDNVVEMDRERK